MKILRNSRPSNGATIHGIARATALAAAISRSEQEVKNSTKKARKPRLL